MGREADSPHGPDIRVANRPYPQITPEQVNAQAD